MCSKAVKNKAKKVFEILGEKYPDVVVQLNHSNSFELTVATILSAQCTDARVNLVTKNLFKKYKTPKDYLKVKEEELQTDIFSLGFYKQKTKSIKGLSKILIEKYNSQIPKDFDELVKLPGVGRKTASVIVANAFGTPAIAVDTHVKRLSYLIGLTKNKNPEKIESDLKKLAPSNIWRDLSHWLIMHGRNICIARRPKCEKCFISQYCNFYKTKQF